MANFLAPLGALRILADQFSHMGQPPGMRLGHVHDQQRHPAGSSNSRPSGRRAWYCPTEVMSGASVAYGPRGRGHGTSAAALGSRSFRSRRASTATRKLEPDMDRAAISGRSTSPKAGSNTPAAIGSATEL